MSIVGHIALRNGKMFCRNCGGQHELGMPIPIDEIFKKFDEFDTLHENCLKALEEPAMTNQINHPPHYGSGEDDPFEAIKVIEAWNLDFHLGNTIKYIARAGKKDPDKLLQDLEKAKWYLDRKIAMVKSNPSNN